jgi:hypothetical protein
MVVKPLDHLRSSINSGANMAKKAKKSKAAKKK